VATHPLYAQDRAVINQLLAAPTPAEAELVDVARLWTRYRDYPGCLDLQQDLLTCLQRWGLGLEELHRRTRAIWASGWRPQLPTNDTQVGSGADVNES
jgi:Protein of unknown function (DUF3288)